MIKILFFLSVIFIVANAQSGFIDGGNTTVPNAGSFNISWNTCNNNGVAVIYVTLSSQYQGWMGLQPKVIGGPISGNVGHINTDIIWSWVDNAGYVHVYDLYSPFIGTPTSSGGNCSQYAGCTDIDSAFPGGTEDVTCVAGSRTPAGTTITWKRNFFATDVYDHSFNGNNTVWALGKDVVPSTYHDITNQMYMHCKDCLKAIYNATCGAAIFTGFRAPCGYNTSSIGYQARNQFMPINWWNGTDPNTLPNCTSDAVAFPQTVCPVAPVPTGTSAASSAAASVSASASAPVTAPVSAPVSAVTPIPTTSDASFAILSLAVLAVLVLIFTL